MIAIVVFIALLLALVLIHELGHFLVARWAGCRVEEFGFGFPPRLFTWKKGETTYSFNLLPIGGFVKIEGEDMEEENPGPRSFGSKSASWRLAILVAGVTMNVLLAAVLLGVQAGVGVPVLVTEENKSKLTDIKTYITAVAPNSPADQAGLEPLDRIVAIDGQEQPTVEAVQSHVSSHAGEKITLEVDRQGQRHRLEVVPRSDPPPGEGALGIGLEATGLEVMPWWRAPWVGISRTVALLVAIVTQFGLIIGQLWRGEGVGETLTGPIGIALYTQEATQLGLSYVLEFGALVSLNLALINILPLPALDGGRILFVLIEKIRGKRLSAKFEGITHTIGFVLLILLMLVITFRDISRYF